MLDPICNRLAKYLQEWLNSELNKMDPKGILKIENDRVKTLV